MRAETRAAAVAQQADDIAAELGIGSDELISLLARHMLLLPVLQPPQPLTCAAGARLATAARQSAALVNKGKASSMSRFNTTQHKHSAATQLKVTRNMARAGAA